MNHRTALTALAALLLAAPAPAQELGEGVQEVRDCAERNLPRSSKQQIALERTDRSGASRRLEANALWKRDEQNRSSFLVRIDAPPDERDAAFLVIERESGNDMFTYLPELRTVRRITSRTVSGSFFGTDFSYEDVLEVQGVAGHARIERLPDAEVEGRPVYVLVGTPAPEVGSSYAKVVTYVDRESCIALKAELFGKPTQVSKEMLIAWADLEKRGERWIPMKVTVRDLEKGSESRIVVEKVELDVDLPDRLFSQSELAKGR
jgi:hypothetical protein